MITQELVAYIKSELKKGKKREDVRVDLLANGGWNDADLGEAFRIIMPLENNTLTPPSAPKPPIPPIPPVPPVQPQIAPEIPTPPTPPSSVSPILSAPIINPFASESSPLRTTKSPRATPWLAIFLTILFIGLCLVFYFYRSQALDLLNKLTTLL